MADFARFQVICRHIEWLRFLVVGFASMWAFRNHFNVNEPEKIPFIRFPVPGRANEIKRSRNRWSSRHFKTWKTVYIHVEGLQTKFRENDANRIGCWPDSGKPLCANRFSKKWLIPCHENIFYLSGNRRVGTSAVQQMYSRFHSNPGNECCNQVRLLPEAVLIRMW